MACAFGLLPLFASPANGRGGRKAPQARRAQDASGPTRLTGWSRFVPGRLLLNQAVTRAGSSTIEKRTPALWRFSSETVRQASSASARLLNGPLTCAEPSTSLWEFI